MGKVINFNGSDLEKMMIDTGVCNNASIRDTTPSEIIRSALTIIVHHIWEDKDKRPIVVIDEEGKALARFCFKGKDKFIGDFTIKAPNRLKTKPIYIFDLLEEKTAYNNDIILKYTNLCIKNNDTFYMAIAVIFRIIREWMEENKDDGLSLFSVFETKGTNMIVSNDILCTANRICERDYLKAKLKDFNLRW